MADNTTRYGFPYQEVTDAPDGAGLGQDLAEAVESALGGVDDDLTAVQAQITTGNYSASKWKVGAGIVASSGAIAATETVVITLPSFTYKAGRAYRVEVAGGVVSSVANNTPLFRVRKTNTSGAQFDAFRATCISTASTPARYTTWFRVGAADVAAVLVLTLTGSGAFTATLSAAATSPASVNVYDDEAGTNFAWAPVLT